MRLSFTKARKKSVLELNTKVWLLCMCGAILIMASFSIVLSLKGANMLDKRDYYVKEREEGMKTIEKIDKELDLMLEKKRFGEDVYSHNHLLSESINNLFALIPDQITLHAVDIQKNRLILKGITPSKDVYSYLLSVPLKSVFSESDVNFYQTNDTWYNFVSVNRLNEEEGKIE